MGRHLKYFAAAIVLAAPAALADVDTRFMRGIGDARYQEFASETLGRNFHLYIMLPDDYGESAAKAYPTVYLLDGSVLFPMLAAYHRYLNMGEEVPDAIVVAICYASNTFEGGNFRSTDFTAKSTERSYWGGAETYQQFLRKELLPSIEKTYRSDPERRILFGHSLGGQFVLYSALTRPTLFWGHIASNPALHRNLPFFLEEHIETEPEDDRSRLFVGSGSRDVPRYRTPALEWIDHWRGQDDRPWHLNTQTLDGHSHVSAPPAAYRRGMRWLFAPAPK